MTDASEKSRLAGIFASLRARAAKGFIPFITLGDPNLETTTELALMLARVGADVIEIGLPFTDPMADGPVIQRASERALRSRVGLSEFFEVAAAVRKSSEIGIVLFSYLNPVLQYGVERLAAECRRVGVDGVLLTDLPIEEAGDVTATLRQHGRDIICLISPTTSDERLPGICAVASGFLYAISRTGITGTRLEVAASAKLLVERARRLTGLPLAVGFGISHREHVEEVWEYADAAVVGSAIVETIEEHLSDPALVKEVERFVRALLPKRVSRRER